MLLYVDPQFVSPYAMSAFVSLREKEVPFDVETVDLSANENQTTAFATKSITSKRRDLRIDAVPGPLHRDEGWLYFDAVRDRYPRRIAGWWTA
jgi:hypothetical protein